MTTAFNDACSWGIASETRWDRPNRDRYAHNVTAPLIVLQHIRT